MAGENDQTRWIGIRPTNPAENIPVTESAPLSSIEVEPKAGCGNFPVTESTPLTSIKVSPLAVGTEFKTSTVKRSPAIADAGSIEAMVAENKQLVAGAGNIFLDVATVPAGKIWKILAMNAFCSTGNPTSIRFYIQPDVIRFYFSQQAYGVAWDHTPWDGEQWANAGDKIGCLWLGCVVNDVLSNTLIGYQVDKY